LIYGIPGLSNSAWLDEIEKALSLNIEHISAYNLTVEQGTALEVLINKKKFPKVEEELGMEQFEILMDELEKGGFEHYEISNFARSGLYSRHNTSYWNRKKYLGIGPSAHSYNLVSRSWNTSNLQSYFTEITNGQPIMESEILSENDHYNEFVMLSLRTSTGASLPFIKNHFPLFTSDFIARSENLIMRGLMERIGENFRLTKKGKLLADGIASDFFQ
jgi:oxygen-independent coproporphyrinogen III oxidase